MSGLPKLPAKLFAKLSLVRLFVEPDRLRAGLMVLGLLVAVGAGQPVWAYGHALTFAFQGAPNLPATPSSILIQSPSYIDVPAGAVLRVHLMRGDVVVTSSKLTFAQAFQSTALIPPAPLASFLPLSATNTSGQPLANATLEAGKADLTAVAQAPAAYRFLWELSDGVMGTPGRAVITGLPVAFVDLKLCAVSAAKALGDQKPGSVLIFPRYTSSASNALREDTRLTLTNTNPSASTFVRLFFVGSATCEIAELTLCLAAQQSVSLQMSEIDPGVKGYVMAIAADLGGRPTQFNWLIGQGVVRQPTGLGNTTMTLSAYAVAKLKDGVVSADNANLAELIFDDVNYDRLPAQIAFDSVPSQVNGANTTQLSFFRPLPNLAGGSVSSAVQLTVAARNAENQVVTASGSLSLNCFSETNLSAVRLSPTTVNNLIAPGTTAWITASTADLQPLFGVLATAGEFNTGNLGRALTFCTEYRIKVPVQALTCP